jgi:hypothetical protein
MLDRLKRPCIRAFIAMAVSAAALGIGVVSNHAIAQPPASDSLAICHQNCG